jgi:hypothetical protein
MPTRAELQIFSGRPQPTWELTPTEAAELGARLRRLRAGTRPPASPALGYRGIDVVSLGGDGLLPPRVHAFGGVVTTTSSGDRTFLADGGDVERWLLGLARQRGYGSLVDQVAGAESAPRERHAEARADRDGEASGGG